MSNIKVVDSSYDTPGGTSKRVKINKGQLNKLRLRPHRIDGHVESSRTIQGIVTSTNIVGQIFKASADNLESLNLTMSIGGTETSIDNFESYADSAELQAVWEESNRVATLEEVIVSPNSSSTKSAKFNLRTLADEWINTIAGTDFTGKKFTFDFLQTIDGTTGSFEFFIGDNAETKSINISAQFAQNWETIEILESDMVDDGATSPDMTAIITIGFRVSDNANNEFFYIDNLTHAVGEGSVELKLFDLGASLPAVGVTLSDGTQYTTLGDLGVTGVQASSVTIPLRPGINLYHVEEFAAGIGKEMPSNVLINKDNFYAVTINYIDVDADVYGVDSSLGIKYYRDGYAFTATNESSAITRIGDGLNHIMFLVPHITDVYVTKIGVTFYDSSGNEVVSDISSASTVYIEDNNMKVIVSPLQTSNGVSSAVFDLETKPVFVPEGSKIEIYYSSGSGEDAVDSICLSASWWEMYG